MKRSRVNRVIESCFSNPLPIKNIPCVHKDLPVIVNMVATVKLLPEDTKYKFPLEAIAMNLSGLIQFAPCKFAADILRLKDSTTDTTALVFRSGKIVIVGGLTKEHVRYCMQVFRSLIEKVKCVMLDEHDNFIIDNLQGRTVFDGCTIHNIVGHGFLGIRINLKTLRDAAPEIAKWEPDIFPGLKFRAWLTKSGKCECKIVNKCMCTCKCLLFDTGKIVITGGRDVSSVNSVFFRVKRLVPSFQETDELVDRELRFAYRFGKLLQDGFGQKIPQPRNEEPAPRQQEQEQKKSNKKLSETEAIALTIAQATQVLEENQPATQKRKIFYEGDNDSSVTPFMKACDLGQLNNVIIMLDCEPELAWEEDKNGKTALQRLRDRYSGGSTMNRTYDKIITLLEKNKKN